MAVYTIKELATTFGCSKQSIFNYMEELNKQGFTSKKGNQILVNEAGFNYIREKKQSSGRVAVKETNSERTPKKEELQERGEALFYKLQNESYEKLIDELKKEKEYYIKLVEDKDNYIKHLQDNLVEISLKAMQISLPQGNEQRENREQEQNQEVKQEDTKQSEEPTEKRSFLSRLFSKK